MVVKYFRLAFQPRTKRWIVTTARSCRISFCLRCLARYILMIAWNTKHLHTDGQTIGHVSSNLHHFILFNQKNLYLFPFNYVLFLLREFFSMLHFCMKCYFTCITTVLLRRETKCLRSRIVLNQRWILTTRNMIAEWRDSSRKIFSDSRRKTWWKKPT